MTDRAGLASHVEALSRSTVLCVGDLMLDRFVYGAVTRVSPEAPRKGAQHLSRSGPREDAG